MGEAPSNHPAHQILDAFGLGKLDETAADAVGQHLESCPSCRRRVAELTSDTFLDHFRGACVRPDSIGSMTTWPPSLDADPASPPSSTAGTLPRGLRYQVLQCLGDGGQGSAYLARDPGLDRLVVLKRYHTDGAAVEYEGQALARVRSRYTAQCYHLERHGDERFLVMEYIPGQSLSEARERRELSPMRRYGWSNRWPRGWRRCTPAAWCTGTSSRSNIILGDDGVPRLVDFGLAAHRW